MSVFNDMVSFLDESWVAKDVIVPCLVGPTGIGKTQAVYQHARNVNAGKVVLIVASQILPTEVSGLTMPVNETHSMEIFDHYKMASLEDGDILFFDELLEADQIVLSACLTLIESRQMMSGKKLPDIQIIAATNPTIQPTMLKENIRQRFVFRTFDMDRQGCRKYILDQFGLDVGDAVNYISDSGDEYNILTQRSLTKMAQWINSTDDYDKASRIASEISAVWKMGIGKLLFDAWKKKYKRQEEIKKSKEVLNMIGKVLVEQGEKDNLDEKTIDVIYNNDTLDDDISIEDLMDVLSSLEGWDDIKNKLENIEIEYEDFGDKDINKILF